ncbi:MAG: LacI family DNA-binding transcriptional regulator [Phycisphaerae bacterium]|nr:LacI family DNA-binding transcriptional regulator [Phycisphaerae bacterium]
MVVTIKDIARTAGVSIGTVSHILNHKPGRYAPKTRQAVLATAKSLGYQPSAAARALATRRTGQIGLILSDPVEGRWANLYFNTFVRGMEKICRESGYSLNLSLHDLVDADSFVLPAKVGQRSVDAVVLAGFVTSNIVKRFVDFGLPCLCVGEDVGEECSAPVIWPDMVAGRLHAIRHAASLGHRRMGFLFSPTPRCRQQAVELRKRVAQDAELEGCDLTLIDLGMFSDYQAAGPLMDHWLGIEKSERPTLLMASDETLAAFLRELHRRGLRCPEDVSLISAPDTRICELTVPALTAVRRDLAELGGLAARMVIDHLENDTPLQSRRTLFEESCELTIRESCGPLS